MRSLRLLVGAVALLTGILVLVVVALDVAANGVDADAPWLLSWLGFLVVGGFLVIRQPRNRVSWVLFGIGLFVSIGAMSESAAGLTGAAAFGVLNIMAVIGFLLLPLLLLWYPTGRPPSPGWTWLERTIVALGSITAVYYVLRPGEIGATKVPNPMGLAMLAGLRDSLTEQLAGLAVLLTGVLAFWSLIVRWRRGAQEERQQIKFVVAAGFFLIGLAIVGIVLTDVLQVIDGEGLWGLAPFVLGLNAIAVAIAVAIVKYHLYDIDRIISRTLSYAVVIGVLGTFFAFVVSLPGFLISGAGETDQAASAPPIVVAAATLAAAALFNPLRKRVAHSVDRHFNRSPYHAESVFNEFVQDINKQPITTELADHWSRVVMATMQPSSIGVWIADSPTDKPV